MAVATTGTRPGTEALVLPWLPPGYTMALPGRGEVFYRWFRHPDPSAPTVLLLHGWTASADLQFFTAYEALAEHFSIVAVDHRGHGRGLRSPEAFELSEVAEDAALLVHGLGIERVITVGYSMGGPISLLLAHRHPELVAGMVVQATALEWRAQRWERWQWKAVRLLGPLLRSRTVIRMIDRSLRNLLGPRHPMLVYVPWMAGEFRRNDVQQLVHAGRSLGRYDAREFAPRLGVPAASLITTRDRLVWPSKQYALAHALHAHIVEIPDDLLVSLTSPHEFATVTVRLVQHVAAG